MNAADVVIIGAGVLGAVCALELTRAGHSVVVIERGAPNREGSGTTAGNLHIQAIHTRRPGQAIAADNERFLPLQIAASSLWDQLDDSLSDDIELTRRGGFMVAETADQLNELQEKHEMELLYGLETELIAGDSARALMPQLSKNVIGASWCSQDGYANPLLLTPAMLKEAKRRGAEIHAFSQVHAIKRTAETFEVSFGEERVSAGAVVNAAGPWIADVAALAGIDIEMSPVSIQMHLTERTSADSLPYLVQHISKGLSVKQVTAGNILIGGGWPSEKFRTDQHAHVSIESIYGNLAQAASVLPMIRELRLLRSWTGPLAATPDEMPVIGEVPEVPGFFVAGGTYAFTLTPLWGRTIRCLLEGEVPPQEIGDLGVDRLVRGVQAAK